MLVEEKNKFLKNQIYLQFFILINYFFYLIHLNNYLIIFNTLIILFFFIKNLIFSRKNNSHFIILLIIIYAFISLGSPLTEWDARSIWLFHAKRIYFDNNIFSQLDNYFPESHNDYPVIAASLSASLAKLINGWNEIFPKFANVIMMTSPLLFLDFLLIKKIKKLLFCFVIFFIFEKRIIVGEMDSLLGLYFTLLLILLANFYLEKKFSNRLLLIYIFINLIIFSLIKTEGLFLIFIIFLSYVLSSILNKKRDQIKNISTMAFVFLFSLIPIMHWKYLVYINNINFFTTELFSFDILIERFLQFDLYFKIFELYFFNKHVIISLLFLSFLLFTLVRFDEKKNHLLIHTNRIDDKFILQLFLISNLIYFFVIFFSILSSNYFENMIIEINRIRYNLPISFALCYAVLIVKIKKH